MNEASRRNWLRVWLGIGVVVYFVGLPFVGLIDPQQPSTSVFEDPSLAHPLGTDQFGRDNLSRTLWALREAVAVTALATAIAGILGLLLGAAILVTDWADHIVGVVINVSLTLPGILLALVLLTFFEPSIVNVGIAVGLSLSPVFSRVARGAFLSIRTLGYIEASVALGADRLHIFNRHILPNALRELLSFLGVIFSWSALNIAAFDFLGVAGSASTPSIGNLLSDGRTYLRVSPWIALGPGIALTLLAYLAFWLSGTGQRS